MNHKSKQVGLTLLEMLVVLLLTSLIATLLLQTVSFMLGSYQRVSFYQQKFVRDTLAFSWYRGSIKSLVASLDSEFAFAGDEYEISGYTLAPVMGQSGVLTKINWRLAEAGEDQQLWYQENSNPPFVIRKWRAESAEFAYRGQGGEWLSTWPQQSMPVGMIPHKVILRTTRDGEVRNVLAGSDQRRLGRYDFRDLQ